MNSVYEKITDLIISKLELGVIPWRKPWTDAGPPCNLITKRPYRGINLLLLSCAAYGQPYFLSFNQVKKLGGTVRKDEKAYMVVFYKWLEATDVNGEVIFKEDGKPKMLPLLRYYYVFNVEQCYGIDAKHLPEQQPIERQFQPIETAEQIVSGMPDKPGICYFGTRAFYNPTTDRVNLPVKTSFVSDAELYSTLFHELVHATGHSSRLARPAIGTAAFGSENYSKEELIAEMGSAFLCAEAGIENRTIDNSAAYIGNWLERLRDDKRLVVLAAGAAQKACDYILKRQSQTQEDKHGGSN
jgi:antirestriction protein ArdC